MKVKLEVMMMMLVVQARSWQRSTFAHALAKKYIALPET